MFLYPHQMHHYYAVKEPWEVRWITFNGTMASGMLESFDIKASDVLSLADPGAVLAKIDEVSDCLRSKDPLRYMKCSALVYEIALDLYTLSSSSDMRSKQEHYEQLWPALSYIEDHFHEAVTLAELADQLRLSPQYTCLLFQKTLGLRPFEYINRYRLRRAKELLLQDNRMDVKVVARAVGYEHASYFIKIFKQQEGITPNAFRRFHLSGNKSYTK